MTRTAEREARLGLSVGEGTERLPATICENLGGPSVSCVGGLGKASRAVGRGRTVQENATARVTRGDSKGPLRVRKNQRVWRVGEKKGRGRGAAGRLLVSERKRENCRDTATRAKTKFYSYSRTRTTRMTIFIPLGGPRSEHNIDRWRNLHRSILHCQLNRLQSKSGTKLLSCLL